MIGVAASDIPSIPYRSGRLCLIGDTQGSGLVERLLGRENNIHRMPLLLAEMARRRPDAVWHLGDVTSFGALRRAWTPFLEARRALTAAQVPLLPLLGNHDLMGSPRRGLAHMRRAFPGMDRWYARRWGPLLLVGLDSNLRHLSAAEKRRQLQFLQACLAVAERDSTVRGLLAGWHHGPMTNSWVVRPSTATATLFLDPLRRSPKLRATFHGHCHNYERFELCRNGGESFWVVVSGGGGGPHQPLRRGRWERFPARCAPLSRGALHFLELTLEPDGTPRIDVIQLDQKNHVEQVDTFVLARLK